MIKLLSRKLREKQENKKKGFTLIELIIVMAIMVILAAVAVPQFSAYRQRANNSSDVAAAKNIHTAVNVLIADGTIATGINFNLTDGSEESQAVLGFLDGARERGTNNEPFVVDIGDEAAVTIFLGDTQVYPEANE